MKPWIVGVRLKHSVRMMWIDCLSMSLLFASCAYAMTGSKTFEIQLAHGQSLVIELREKATILKENGKITKEEQDEVINQTKQSELELQSAKTMHEKEPDSAYMRLKTALAKIEQYREALSNKEKR